MDHFSQATLFFNSMSDPEKNHITDALSFELGKVDTIAIRERMLGILAKIDKGLATAVAYNIGVHIPKDKEALLNHSIPADADPKSYQPVMIKSSVEFSSVLSMSNTIKDSIKTRKIAILAAEGVNEISLNTIKDALVNEGAVVDLIAPRLGKFMSKNDVELEANKSFLNTASVFYDAVYLPGGSNSVATLEAEPDAIHFLNEAYRHCKAIAADEEAIQILQATYFSKKIPADISKAPELMDGVYISDDTKQLSKSFIAAIAQHRFWQREVPRKVPA